MFVSCVFRFRVSVSCFGFVFRCRVLVSLVSVSCFGFVSVACSFRVRIDRGFKENLRICYYTQGFYGFLRICYYTQGF